MNKKLAWLFYLIVGLMGAAPGYAQISVYGAWHCGNDYCNWKTVRTVEEFESKNHWLIERGLGQPSVNLVVLSFVHPLNLLNNATPDNPLNGIPPGMTPEIVNYFTSKGIRVMLSIGGITYVSAWNQALATNPTKLGHNAAAVAKALGVGIEIDYEENKSPNLAGLQAFIDAYRADLPYDEFGKDPAARLTIDLAEGDRWLIALTRKATADWLSRDPNIKVLDYANAMVGSRQPTSATDAQSKWQEHIDGKPQYSPPILPLAPARFTGSLFLVGSKPIPECTNFSNSLEKATGNYVTNVAPNGAGVTYGMLGYMFWAAECSGKRSVCTTPPNSCEGGVGVGATFYNIPMTMPPLRGQ